MRVGRPKKAGHEPVFFSGGRCFFCQTCGKRKKIGVTKYSDKYGAVLKICKKCDEKQ